MAMILNLVFEIKIKIAITKYRSLCEGLWNVPHFDVNQQYGIIYIQETYTISQVIKMNKQNQKTDCSGALTRQK
ncbi:hypothetical protein JHK85_011221 [Glycine max]|uniref:Uncharacterized protein n=1 Tax=Glycine max TaxID=3847 RepID=K7KLE5_SOYBN|nr:hypothetical protein JHK85_011221 [Glycine max]KAH1112441.1 hypothetical protein GYH30_010619 [Glycine max]